MRRRYLIEAINVKMKKKVQWYVFFLQTASKLSEVNSPLDKITLVFRG